jgi:hypothetical protein
MTGQVVSGSEFTIYYSLFTIHYLPFSIACHSSLFLRYCVRCATLLGFQVDARKGELNIRLIRMNPWVRIMNFGKNPATHVDPI